MTVTVAISTVDDGSMAIRENQSHPDSIKNRKTFLSKNGIAIQDTTRLKVTYDRDNFCIYRDISVEEKAKGMFDAEVTACDGLITRNKKHALFLTLADCVGAVLYDKKHEILMLSHLGRHSVEQDGGYQSVLYLIKNYGSEAQNVKVWLSPAPGVSSYPLFAFNNRDYKEVVFEQLYRAGILENNILDNPADTSSDPRYYSHSNFLAGKGDDGSHAIVAMME